MLHSIPSFFPIDTRVIATALESSKMSPATLRLQNVIAHIKTESEALQEVEDSKIAEMLAQRIESCSGEDKIALTQAFKDWTGLKLANHTIWRAVTIAAKAYIVPQLPPFSQRMQPVFLKITEILQNIRISVEKSQEASCEQKMLRLDEVAISVATYLQAWEKAETAEARATNRISLYKVIFSLERPFPNNREDIQRIIEEIRSFFRDNEQALHDAFCFLRHKVGYLSYFLENIHPSEKLLGLAMEIEILVERELSTHRDLLTKDCVEKLEQLKSKITDLSNDLTKSGGLSGSEKGKISTVFRKIAEDLDLLRCSFSHLWDFTCASF